jgi:hypothetical protein
MTPVFFTEVSRSSHFPLVLVGGPRKDALTKGQVPSWVTRWIAPGPSPLASESSSWPLPDHSPVFTIELPTKMLGHRCFEYTSAGHTYKHGWCDLAILQAPLITTMVFANAE